MKKRNLILTSAVALAFGAAATASYAGNMATTTFTFATENFGTGVAATIAVTPAATSYAVSSPGGVTLASGQQTTLYFRLSGTATFAAGAAAADFTSPNADITAMLAGAAAPTYGTGAFLNTMALTLVNTSAGSYNLPLGSTIIWTPTTAVNVPTATLATAGGQVTVIGSMSGTAVNNNATTLLSDQDPIAPPVIIATSAQAFTGEITSSAAFTAPETKQIDLAAGAGVGFAFSPANSISTGNTVVNLGEYSYTNNPSIIPVNTTGGPYTLPAADGGAGVITGTTVTVTPDAGHSFPATSTLDLISTADCAVANTILAAPVATAGNAAVTINNLVAGKVTPGTGIKHYICLTVAGTNAITPITPTGAVVLKKLVGTDTTSAIATTPLYPLTYNGSLVDVTNYVPAALAGYQQWLRIANTGTLDADISGAWIDPVTGDVGTSQVIVSGLKKLGTTNIDSAAIEAILGAPPAPAGGTLADARPRLRITAPTNNLTVQNILFVPNGSFTNNSAAQSKNFMPN